MAGYLLYNHKRNREIITITNVSSNTKKKVEIKNNKWLISNFYKTFKDFHKKEKQLRKMSKKKQRVHNRLTCSATVKVEVKFC
jgi:hypothetical protein